MLDVGRWISAATSTRTNQNANICCQQVDNNFSPPTMEQKMACPSNTPYTILKDGIVLLEHEACQEQPLDLLGTFKNRNPAMGTHNLCGFYYRMTDFVASQLYHLSDIIKANSAIRGSNLHRHSICQRMENQDQILEKYIQNKYVHFECQVQSG